MRSKLLVRVVSVFALCLFVEGLSFAALMALWRVRRISYAPTASALSPEARSKLDAFLARRAGERMDMDPVLGWVVASADPDANEAGMRDDREYDRVPTPGILRISAFGDSFTYGSDVPLGESWAKRIPALASRVEVLNYGVPAYGLDQAYLRYLKLGADYQPDVVFIGYMTENLARNVNVYRPFYAEVYRDAIYTKPRFRVESGALVLVPNPLATLDEYRRLRAHEAEVLSEIGRQDYHFIGRYPAGALDFSRSVRLLKLAAAELRRARQVPIFTPDGRYDPRSEAYEVTLRIFDDFYRKVVERGALPIIVVFPDTNDQQRSRERKPRRHAPLVEYFRSRGYRFIDALDAIESVQDRYSISDLSVRWGHYSKLGNEIIAKFMLQRLAEWDLDAEPQTSRAAEAERQRLGIRAGEQARGSGG